MTLLFLNDSLVDLDSKTKIGITRQVNDIAELKNRNADYSNQFKIPLTEKNRAIFNNCEQVQNTSKFPYQNIPAKLVNSGVEIIGYVVVQVATEKEYNCVFYAGNLNFFSIIGTKKISDLDLSVLEHDWTMDNVVESRNNQWNDSGYIYPLIDTVGDGINFLNVAPAAEWRWLTPWVFVRRIWGQIFKEAGFNYTGKFLESDRFNNLITNLVTNKPQDNNIEWEAIHGTITPFPQNAGVAVSGNYLRTITLISDTLGQTSTIPATATNPLAVLFTPDFSGQYSFICNINILTSLFNKVSRIDVVINEKYTSGAIIQRRVVKSLIAGVDFNSLQFTFDLTDIYMDPDEAIIMRLVFFPLADPGEMNTFLIQPSTGMKLTKSKYDAVKPGLPWKIQENLYEMTQTDFIKNICQRFCLIPDTEKLINEIEFFQFSEIIDSIPEAYDFSDKVTNKTQVIFRDKSYGQNSLMTFAEPKDFETITKIPVDGDFGDYTFIIEDSALEINKTVIELMFHPSMMVLRFLGIPTPKILFHDRDAPEVGVWKNDVGARILSLNRVSGNDFAYMDLDVPTTTIVDDDVPFCYFKDQGQLYDLTFESASKTDYKDLIRVIQDYKSLSESVLLTPVDVSQYKFKRPVFIKKYNSYFYMNKIVNYFDGKYCTIEILRLR